MSTNQLLASGQAGQDLAVYHNGDFNAYMANKINKLNIMYNTGQGIATSIFFGCACLITGHTTPSLDELRRLILANGGIFHGYEQDSTTHFICDRFAAPKTVRMRKTRSRGKLFYVTAAWVVESVTAEKRLREILFLPRSLDTNGGSSMRTFVCNGENSKQVEDDLTVGALIAEAVANMDGDDELFDKFQPDIVPDDNTESPTLAATKRVHSSTNFNMNEAMLGYESDCTLIDSQTQSLPIDEAEDELNHAFIAEDEEEEKAEDYIDVEQEHGMIAERLDSIFSSPIPDPKNKSPLSRGALSTNDDPNFLNNFFSNSRLHFIGTWRNRLAKFAKRMLQQSKRDPSASTSTSSSRVVVHVDMDCFFVSVLTRSMPHLHDRPVVVAHGSSDGCEISSCNYKARAKGLKNGMFMRQAKQLCTDMVILKYDFKQYEEVSERVYSIFYSIEQAVVVMPVSVDEAYLEFAPHCNGLDMALMIRNRVITETRCPCSAGVGPNMMLAKIATRKAKPNGQFEINAYNLDECMSELDLNELPGVGWESSRKLAVHGFKYLRDIATLSKDALQGLVGKSLGTLLWSACRGIDDRPLIAIPSRNSVSIDVNYGLRFDTLSRAENFLRELSAAVSSRMTEAGVRGGQTLTVKLLKRRPGAPEPFKQNGHGICDAVSKSTTLRRPVHAPADLESAFLPLFRVLTEGVDATDLRGMSVQVGRLDSDDELPQSRLASWLQPIRPAPATPPSEINTDVQFQCAKNIQYDTNVGILGDILCDSNSYEHSAGSLQGLRIGDEGGGQITSLVSSALFYPIAIPTVHIPDQNEEMSNLSVAEEEFLHALPPELAEEQRILLRQERKAVLKRTIQDADRDKKHRNIGKAGKNAVKPNNKKKTKFEAPQQGLSLFGIVTSNCTKRVDAAIKIRPADADDYLDLAMHEESSDDASRSLSRSSYVIHTKAHNAPMESELIDTYESWSGLSCKEFDTLLRAWVGSFPHGFVPSEEEVAILVEYGISLITSGLPDKAVKMMNAVRRAFSKAGQETGANWEAYCDQIIVLVQEEAVKRYSTKLFLNRPMIKEEQSLTHS